MLEPFEIETKTKSAACATSQTTGEVVFGKNTQGGPGAPSEHELVDLALDGDAKAFGQLIKLHQSACLSRAMLIVRNRGDAEDEVQNACWKAFQYRDQFRREGTFAAWLTRIVENQCLMRIRQQRNAHFLH